MDLAILGFDGVVPETTGRPAYHPATLLKIYLYGYLNRVQSSRRLEREAQRNIELMWLTGRLAPDFKTIADFRKDNAAAIRAVCCQFVVLCRELGLFTRAVVAIDGSKLKAVNNRDKNYTVAKVTGRNGPGQRQHRALPEGAGPGRPRRERYRRGQVGPAEGEDSIRPRSGFAQDSLLEGTIFELSVPENRRSTSTPPAGLLRHIFAVLRTIPIGGGPARLQGPVTVPAVAARNHEDVPELACDQ